MSMHMIRGVQVHGKSKRKRKPGWQKAMADHEKRLKELGIKGTGGNAHLSIPDYNTGPRMTSDKVAGNGALKEQNKYTGNEIAGIVTTHKSNLMPVRKDNKQSFKDAANMRR